MERSRIFLAVLGACALVLIGGAVLAAPGTASIGNEWVFPIKSLNGATIEANSPYALHCVRYDTDSFVKVLAFIEMDGGSIHQEIKKVSLYGYWLKNPEGTEVIYSLWIPNIPSGRYDIHISLQQRAMVWDGQNYGRWGPWEEAYRETYNVIVIENDNYYGGLGSVATSSVDQSVQAIEGTERLTPTQQSVLASTLADERKIRGF
ncbi:MAG: hypothetical protein PHV29_01175 [Candidatus Pacebacteria bacterium]|nr:hypothetical protein [Candidatus Paceibacterota bacterium]MDD2757205.1 hypothetical protein [Candidatus Paceibacterota bacterium]MDD4737806.1 hypothetical protein [Candidatus Paceibacterota bacterium]